MGKLSELDKARLDEFTASNETMRISCLPQGFYEGSYIAMSPCIFIGPKNKTLLLWKNEVTIEILKKILDKAIRDKNISAAVALLRYAINNKKRFWQSYKKTSLGIRVMADILGKHE